jgi:hypothetical protein
MTSQIAIFNPLGVAVASDTVTTVISDKGTKTTNNAEKMWPLVGGHLVVVIVSGSVAANGIHSRLLVSEWNRTLEGPLPTLSSYAESFIKWLSDDSRLIPEESEKGEIHFYLNDHYYEIRRRVLADAEELQSDEDIFASFETHVRSAVEHLQALPLYEGMSDDLDSQLLTELDIDLDDKLNYIFKGFPGLDALRQQLKDSAPLVISRSQPMPSDTDLAFIGFGADEYFATTVGVKCRGRYGKKARVALSEPFGIEAGETSGSIKSFAQDSAIFGFLRGAQYGVLNTAYEYVWDLIVAENEDNTEFGLAKARETIDGMRARVDNHMSEMYVSPMLDAIGSLSLKDVAELGEALVGIQAMRAVASPEPASVGGFIESLIIDRADGIRWVKRLPR